MKKICAFALALCLLGGGAALAEQTITESSNKPATTVLTTTISEGYTIKIPATVEIPFNQVETELPIEVTTLHLNPSAEGSTRKLQVRLWEAGALTNGTGGKLGNAIEGTGLVKDQNYWYLYFTEIGTKSITIKIPSTAWNKAPAGDYSSTMKFYITLGDY